MLYALKPWACFSCLWLNLDLNLVEISLVTVSQVSRLQKMFSLQKLCPQLLLCPSSLLYLDLRVGIYTVSIVWFWDVLPSVFSPFFSMLFLNMVTTSFCSLGFCVHSGVCPVSWWVYDLCDSFSSFYGWLCDLDLDLVYLSVVFIFILSLIYCAWVGARASVFWDETLNALLPCSIYLLTEAVVMILQLVWLLMCPL